MTNDLRTKDVINKLKELDTFLDTGMDIHHVSNKDYNKIQKIRKFIKTMLIELEEIEQ